MATDDPASISGTSLPAVVAQASSADQVRGNLGSRTPEQRELSNSDIRFTARYRAPFFPRAAQPEISETIQMNGRML